MQMRGSLRFLGEKIAILLFDAGKNDLLVVTREHERAKQAERTSDTADRADQI